mmetsp:Transcript_39488/g.99535  ORF Transcript_39488/g.99535 Transcript_39488/m.99535 type:complete len:293 (+) Transcript_39488:132-1010(+)
MAAESREENERLGVDEDADEEATCFLNSWATAFETGVLDDSHVEQDVDDPVGVMHSGGGEDAASDLVQCPTCSEMFDFEVLVSHLEACEAAQSRATKSADTPMFDDDVREMLSPPASFKGCSDASLVHEQWLFVGSSTAARSTEFLAASKVGWLLNCADDVVLDESALAALQIQYHHLQLADSTSSRLTPFFEEAHAFIERAHGDPSKRTLLVHCSAGVSRSAALVVAYLMQSQRRTLLDCLRQVRSRRPFVYPNKRFMSELILLEKRLFDGAPLSIPEEALCLHEDQDELD